MEKMLTGPDGRRDMSGFLSCFATKKTKLFSISVVPVPPSLVATSVHPTSISLSWSDHPDGGSLVTLYKIFTREVFAVWKVLRAEPEIRTFMVRDLR